MISNVGIKTGVLQFMGPQKVGLDWTTQQQQQHKDDTEHGIAGLYMQKGVWVA